MTQTTLFTTPVLRPLLRGVSRLTLQLGGWRLEGGLPAGVAKSVVVAAPHTSNWDLPYTLMGGFAFDLNVVWMGKASLFRPPFGALMRWLGGLPVDRSKPGGQVGAVAQVLREAPGMLQLVVSPEGTRGRTAQWKTGFYFIAREAGLPIVLGYVDYGRKVIGLGPEFRTTGDVERDLGEIRRFYAGIAGRRADRFDAG